MKIRSSSTPVLVLSIGLCLIALPNVRGIPDPTADGFTSLFNGKDLTPGEG